MSLKKTNNLLLALIILLNVYVIAGPILPALLFRWQSHSGRQQQLQREIRGALSKPPPSQSHQLNSIIIPRMLLNQPIYEGTIANQYKTLDKGIWRWPNSSTPAQGGNTVLIGHRFTYTKPQGVFYFLNKIKLGDEMAVIWNDKAYAYKVISINQVPPNDTAIENNTPYSELTLFTCTPLWLPKDRLVVVASLESQP